MLGLLAIECPHNASACIDMWVREAMLDVIATFCGHGKQERKCLK